MTIYHIDAKMFSRIIGRFTSKKSKKINFLNIFKPIYILLSLIGIYPYSLKFCNNGCKIIYKSIYFNCVCALSLILITLVFVFLHIRYVVMFTDSSSFTDAITTQINYIFEVFNLILFSVVAYFSAYQNSLKYVNILNNLVSSWNDTPKMNNEAMELFRSRVNKCLIFLAMLVFANICVNFTRKESFWKMTLVVFSFNLPQLIQYVEIIYFCVLILMVVAVLSAINDTCLNMLKEKRNFTGGYFIKVETGMPTSSMCQLEQIYVRVMETKRDINEAFQAPLLMSMLQCFHSMVSQAYTIYHGTVATKLTLHEIINCLLWFAYQAIKVLALAYTGNLLKRQVSCLV